MNELLIIRQIYRTRLVVKMQLKIHEFFGYMLQRAEICREDNGQVSRCIGGGPGQTQDLVQTLGEGGVNTDQV